MQKIAVYKFLTFYILTFNSHNEPPHLQIAKEKGKKQRSARIWLNTLEIKEKGSLSDSELNTALNQIKNNRYKLMKSYKMLIEGKKINTIYLD
jgi:hypothetical protein